MNHDDYLEQPYARAGEHASAVEAEAELILDELREEWLCDAAALAALLAADVKRLTRVERRLRDFVEQRRDDCEPRPPTASTVLLAMILADVHAGRCRASLEEEADRRLSAPPPVD